MASECGRMTGFTSISNPPRNGGRRAARRGARGSVLTRRKQSGTMTVPATFASFAVTGHGMQTLLIATRHVGDLGPAAERARDSPLRRPSGSYIAIHHVYRSPAPIATSPTDRADPFTPQQGSTALSNRPKTLDLGVNDRLRWDVRSDWIEAGSELSVSRHGNQMDSFEDTALPHLCDHLVRKVHAGVAVIVESLDQSRRNSQLGNVSRELASHRR